MPAPMEEPLLHPATTTTTSSSSPGATFANILTRISSIIVIAAVSAWAHQESSATFDVSVVNLAGAGTPAGHKFDLTFVSNGAAARLVHAAGRSADRLLYPSTPRVRHVTLLMLRNNSRRSAATTDPSRIVVEISSELMAAGDVRSAVKYAVRRGVARAWLCSPAILPEESMVDYLVAGGGDGRRSSCSTAEFLRFAEERRPGFVAELNRAACLRRDVTWRGLLCAAYLANATSDHDLGRAV